jgi:hypothetical protein
MLLHGLTRNPQSLADWQNNARKDVGQQYTEAVAKMYELDRTLRSLNLRLTYFKESLDANERPMVWLCEPDKPKKRVGLKAKSEFIDAEVRPVSREFRIIMARVRDLHFQCRDTKIDVPKSTFDFLLSWGMIQTGGPKKGPHRARHTA